MQTTLKTIENTNGKNRLIINPHGARIEELVLERQKIFTKVIRGDGKEGSSHPCIPQFGPEITTSFGLPQHGSARNKDFISIATDDKVELSLDIEDGNYPRGLNIKLEHSLSGEKYRLVTKVSNNSDQDLPVNFAQHFYWNVPNGWERLKINGIDVAEIVKNDASIELKPENIIEIPGQKFIVLEQKGFSIFRLWAYKNPETCEYDKNYVCIEPAEGDPIRNYFGSDASMIKPGQSRTAEIFIKLNEF
jgi:galactose mutarotase-like enzyme